MSVRVRPLPQEDQVANVGAGTRLQNVKHEFDSHPGLKKVWKIFGRIKRVCIFALSKTVIKQQTMFTIRIIAMVGGTEKQSPGIPIV